MLPKINNFSSIKTIDKDKYTTVNEIYPSG